MLEDNNIEADGEWFLWSSLLPGMKGTIRLLLYGKLYSGSTRVISCFVLCILSIYQANMLGRIGFSLLDIEHYTMELKRGGYKTVSACSGRD